MDVSAAEAAKRLAVSPQRVRAMLKAGDLIGRQVGGVWILDDAQLLKPRRVGRPLSARTAWVSLTAAHRSDVDASPTLSGPERIRLGRRLDRLRDGVDRAQLLSTWMAARATAVTVSAPEPDGLFDDPDLAPGGVSDARAGLSGGHEYEFYAAPGTLSQVMRRHLLVPTPTGEVLLREAPVRLQPPIPLLLLAADLADRGGPRELLRADELIDLWVQR